MKIEAIPINDLHIDPANVRRHPARNLDSVRASLARFGQQKPIVVDDKGVVRAGNATLEAAKSLGWEEVAAVRTPLQGVEATAYAIADNRSAELAEWDEEALTKTLQALQGEDFDLDAVGFTDEEVNELLGLSGDPMGDEGGSDDPIFEKFEIIVECRSESHQRELYERLHSEGLTCRVLTL